jgi:hypothetical protein
MSRPVGSLPFAVLPGLRFPEIPTSGCAIFAAIWDSIAVLTADLAKNFSNTQAGDESPQGETAATQ